MAPVRCHLFQHWLIDFTSFFHIFFFTGFGTYRLGGKLCTCFLPTSPASWVWHQCFPHPPLTAFRGHNGVLSEGEAPRGLLGWCLFRSPSGDFRPKPHDTQETPVFPRNLGVCSHAQRSLKHENSTLRLSRVIGTAPCHLNCCMFHLMFSFRTETECVPSHDCCGI